MSKAAFDLVIVGVGGQGTLLASKILGRLALSENCGVKVSEVHGMSQRAASSRMCAWATACIRPWLRWAARTI